MKKALIVTTVSGFVPQFEMDNVKILQSMGYEVHYAANYDTPSYGCDNHRLDGTGIVRHSIPFLRSPYSLDNRKVYKELRDLMERERFCLVHCHTPMGGVLARLAAHATHTGPVIYTAHGFHFYRGAPLKNWLVYFPAEWFLSWYTDVQICINREDYRMAKRLNAGKRYYVPGVGIDSGRFSGQADIQRKKQELGIGPDKRILLSVGEVIMRKNQELMLRTLAYLRDESLVYILCGHGDLEGHLKAVAKELHIDHQVLFLGYREDMEELYPLADILIHPSFQEGLPAAILEAMASGLAIIGSDIRGNRDLIEDGYNGLLVRDFRPESYGAAVRRLLADEKLRRLFADRNHRLAGQYDSRIVRTHMRKIYEAALHPEAEQALCQISAAGRMEDRNRLKGSLGERQK